jgi:hypothetical protein
MRRRATGGNAYHLSPPLFSSPFEGCQRKGVIHEFRNSHPVEFSVGESHFPSRIYLPHRTGDCGYIPRPQSLTKEIPKFRDPSSDLLSLLSCINSQKARFFWLPRTKLHPSSVKGGWGDLVELASR